MDYVHPPLNQTHIDALTQRIAHVEQNVKPLLARCAACDLPVGDHAATIDSQLSMMKKIKAAFAPNQG